MIVIADSTPHNYLVLIGESELHGRGHLVNFALERIAAPHMFKAAPVAE